MGTRADFYVGRGEQAEWLGSIAWDGYPDGVVEAVLKATNAETYRDEVARFLASHTDATLPDQGWPWPWEDSQLTDYSYAFDGERVWMSPFGHGWQPADEPEPEEGEDVPKVAFPNMKDRQKVTFGPRSGVILFGVQGQ